MRGAPQYLKSRTVRASLAMALALAAAGVGVAQQAGEWPNITGGNNGARFSNLDQINATNFNNLKVAWEWRGVKDAGINLGGAVNARSLPIYVDGMLITTSGPKRTVVSLDPATGKTLWTFQEPTTGRMGTRCAPTTARAWRLRASTAAAWCL